MKNLKKNGFFLIELLISILIFSTIGLLVFQYHTSIILKQRESIKYLKALYLLNNCADELIVGAALNGKINLEDYLVTIIQIYPQKNNASNENLEPERKSFRLYAISVSWIDYKKNPRKIDLITGAIL